jgi:hypothetical protein
MSMKVIRKMMMPFGILLGIALGLVFVFLFSDRERLELDGEVLGRQPGDSIMLADGRVSSVWRGPADGPVVATANPFSSARGSSWALHG